MATTPHPTVLLRAWRHDHNGAGMPRPAHMRFPLCPTTKATAVPRLVLLNLDGNMLSGKVWWDPGHPDRMEGWIDVLHALDPLLPALHDGGYDSFLESLVQRRGGPSRLPIMGNYGTGAALLTRDAVFWAEAPDHRPHPNDLTAAKPASWEGFAPIPDGAPRGARSWAFAWLADAPSAHAQLPRLQRMAEDLAIMDKVCRIQTVLCT